MIDSLIFIPDKCLFNDFNDCSESYCCKIPIWWSQLFSPGLIRRWGSFRQLSDHWIALPAYSLRLNIRILKYIYIDMQRCLKRIQSCWAFNFTFLSNVKVNTVIWFTFNEIALLSHFDCVNTLYVMRINLIVLPAHLRAVGRRILPERLAW